MSTRRPILSAFVALAVAWAALWPLVSGVRAASMDSPVPLCHQAGSQVDMGEAPVQSDAPAGEPKFHCPLCVIAFYGAFGPALTVPPLTVWTASVAADIYSSPLRAGLEVQLPQSRAPPASLPA